MKNTKSGLWGVAVRLSYIQDVWCLKVNEGPEVHVKYVTQGERFRCFVIPRPQHGDRSVFRTVQPN